ncbi:hypothetical protein DPMN_059114 [Dreissena polymorpha]|uniref:Uncharacterized protein n=1 Tax=Dreissena polymorpha TaxID=45954 RepID=A0A9D4C3D5_DREPO|nr:hypothetical protein DPMN_059114 [Dreissena polymorpha]
MDGNGKIGRPLESHHGSVLRYDEVLAILNADQTDQSSNKNVSCKQLQQPDATEQSSLLDDGLNWTTTGSASLPSNRRTVVSKKSCCVVDKVRLKVNGNKAIRLGYVPF